MKSKSRCARLALVAVGLVVCTAKAQPIPTPDHVVIVFEENKSYSQIIGNSTAPYINGLLSQGASLTNMFAITHPSQPNYIAFFSGSQQGVTTNNTPPNLPFTTPNLGAQFIQSGRTFTGYSETLPSVGYTGDNVGGSGGYWRKHNPWVNWQNSGTPPFPPNTLLPTTNQPFTAFPTNYDSLPTLSIVVPNQDNDMHDGTIAQGDLWMRNNLDGYVQWAKTHNSLFIMTFDEDDSSPGNNNRISTILVGGMVRPGVTSNQFLNLYGMLGTLEDMYGLGRIGNAVGQAQLTGIWVSPVPEPSSVVLTAAAGVAVAVRVWRRRNEQAAGS
jgi:phosphatidylinositol-3-phosphatase